MIPPPAVPGSYTSNEVRFRIALYAAVAAMMSMAAGVSDLASMTDEQLHAMSGIRWTFKLSLIAISAAIAAGNTIRAAIDRSTAGGSGATPPATISPTATP